MCRRNKKHTTNTNDNKSRCINMFRSCLDIVRYNEGLNCEKALRYISYLLVLKLIDPHLGNEIDVDDYNYIFDSIEDEYVEYYKAKLLEMVRFSNLASENENNIVTIINY